MHNIKATTETVFARIFEIQIYEPTALPVGPALFHEVQGTLILYEEVLVKGIEETGIVLVLDFPGALNGAHSCYRIVPRTASYMAMGAKKGIEGAVTPSCNRLLLCLWHM
jgi:hypothetical protein